MAKTWRSGQRNANGNKGENIPVLLGTDAQVPDLPIVGQPEAPFSMRRVFQLLSAFYLNEMDRL